MVDVVRLKSVSVRPSAARPLRNDRRGHVCCQLVLALELLIVDRLRPAWTGFRAHVVSRETSPLAPVHLQLIADMPALLRGGSLMYGGESRLASPRAMM